MKHYYVFNLIGFLQTLSIGWRLYVPDTSVSPNSSARINDARVFKGGLAEW